ncbi:DNA cytosine methyltransferase [Parerythrobacter lacustris]|uniref:Cytosine-specific methyltransferase n=1 Tax=Parerythrobacter lacustris TaxID=2969984 RepID=A0ABT1XUB7_9SPHN|nr:DNA cytosine methyltransferase [Parerythrobacter lacustris]MCR2835255.1 DNA cytosine methyltransferase [Parerythrobacter lacustris]
MGWTLIDLFCGAGGMSYGFVDKAFCGAFECVAAVDSDAASIETHKANVNGPAIHMGIEEWLEAGDIPPADVVIGGPPCQGFSLLNRDRVGDERRALWEPFLEVVRLSGASIFVMENVAELYRSPELLDIKAKAKEMGFETVEEVLNTANYGVPQTRRRTIVLGWKEGAFEGKPVFPPLETHRAPDKSSNLPVWRTVKDTISHLPPPKGAEIFGQDVMGLHFGRRPTDKSRARYRAVPPGGNRFDLQKNAPEITPNCWIKKTSGGTDLFGRLWWDRPSVTIRTEFFKPEKGRYLHPEEHRPITHCEAALLMGFPKTFKFKGTKIEVARQIGNAVPPPFARELGEMVASMLQPLKATA